MPKREIKLRDYQEQAITNWLTNDNKGIFEMATGTGKTFTALGCLRSLLKNQNKLNYNNSLSIRSFSKAMAK